MDVSAVKDKLAALRPLRQECQARHLEAAFGTARYFPWQTTGGANTCNASWHLNSFKL